MNQTTRFRFVDDNNGYWYLIPDTSYILFNRLIEEPAPNSTVDSNFNLEFEDFRVGSPTSFTFQSPKEDK